MGKVLRLQPRTNIDYPSDSTGIGIDRQIGTPVISTSPIDTHAVQEQIATQDLYPLAAEIRPSLASAFQLIEEGLKHLNIAINRLGENDPIASDDALLRFQALLPELFCCRDLGDGFGAIMISVFHSLRNLVGAPANKEQLLAIRNIMKRISSEPFIEFQDAVIEISELENCGLNIEPSSQFEYAGDLLIE